MNSFDFLVYLVAGGDHLCAYFESEDDAKDFARIVEQKEKCIDAYVMNSKTGARWYVSDNKSKAQKLAEYRAWFYSEFDRMPYWDELEAEGFGDD